MALSKVTYVDNQTIIGATNLNSIQDEIIANAKTIANKQNTLSSGVNIKSINGESILGSGDLTVTATVTVDNTVTKGSINPVSSGAVYTAIQSGGGGGSGTVKYITTSSTITDIIDAISDGYDVKLQISTAIYELSMYSETARCAAFTRLVNTRDTSGNQKTICTQYAFTDGGISSSTSEFCTEATKVISAGGDTLETLKAGTNIDISDEGVISASGGSGSGATIELNGTSTTAASFYAPTGGGSSETTQYLKSNGSGAAPTWEDLPDIPEIYINYHTDPSTTARVYTPLTAGTSGQFLMSNGDGKAPTWGTVSSSGGSLYVSVADYIETYGKTINAINAAISDCPQHGTVFIPNLGKGNSYTGSNSITITKPMTLLGDYTGWHWSAINSSTTDYTTPLITSSCTTNAIYVNCPGVTIRNISIKATSSSVGIYVEPEKNTNESGAYQDASYNIIDNVSVYPGNNGVGIRLDGAILSKLTRCLVYGGSIGYAVTCVKVAPSTSILFENCWASDFFTYGYSLSGACYTTILNCAADTNNGGTCGYLVDSCRSVSIICCGSESAIYTAMFTNSQNCFFSGYSMPSFKSYGNYAIQVSNSSNVKISDTYYDNAKITPYDTSGSYCPVYCDSGSTVMLMNTNFGKVIDANKSTSAQAIGIMYYTGM